MKNIDRGYNTAYYGTTAERVAMAAFQEGVGIPPFAEWYDTSNGNYYDWYGSWVVRPAGGGAGGGDATAANQVATQGAVSGGAAATKSMLVGGVFNTTRPTLTNGQQGSVNLDTQSNVIISLAGSNTQTGVNAVVANADAIATGGGRLKVAASFELLNPDGTMDRGRGNTNGLFTVPSPLDVNDTGSQLILGVNIALASNPKQARYFIQNKGTSRIGFRLGAAATYDTTNGFGVATMAIGPGQSYEGSSDRQSINLISETVGMPAGGNPVLVWRWG